MKHKIAQNRVFNNFNNYFLKDFAAETREKIYLFSILCLVSESISKIKVKSERYVINDISVKKNSKQIVDII